MTDTPKLDKRFVVSLQGRDYSTYPGVLDRAHQEGIQSLTTTLVQAPDSDNEYTAIVQATVVLTSGAVFSDYGDASPRNTNAKIATALIRMASTRAKGRALRDAVNIGDCLLEELGDDTIIHPPTHAQPVGPKPAQPVGPKPAPKSLDDGLDWGEADTRPCLKCNKPMKAAQVAFCEAKKLPMAHPECRAKDYQR